MKSGHTCYLHRNRSRRADTYMHISPLFFNVISLIISQERTLFVWGFDKTATSLDDLIEYFENNFRNVVNIRQRTAPIKDDKEVGMCMQSETV